MKNSILFLKSRFFLKQILGALLALFVIVVISMQMLAWTTAHGNYIVVPDCSKNHLDFKSLTQLILEAISLKMQSLVKGHCQEVRSKQTRKYTYS